MPKISIVILQFNNSRDTIGCLESVKELKIPENYQLHTVIVDNASEINHLNNIRFFIERQYQVGLGNKEIVLVRSEENLGFSGGVNLGISHSIENNADYIFILNPDTSVMPDLFLKFLETQKIDPKICIFGMTIDEGNRTINRGEISWLKSELKHSRQEVGNLLEQNSYIPGAAMIISKKVFQKIGLFNKKYFLYFEDADFCERARRAGFRIGLIQERLVKHRPSSSTKLLGSAKLLYYHYRNTHLFNWENGPWWVKIALPFWSFWIIVKQTGKIVLGKETIISKAILQGVLDFYKGRFGQYRE